MTTYRQTVVRHIVNKYLQHLGTRHRPDLLSSDEQIGKKNRYIIHMIVVV